MVATGAVATVHGVPVNGHLDVEVVSCRSGPLKRPRSNRVGFLGVREAAVHHLAERGRNGNDVAVRNEDAVAAGTTVPINVVDFHDVVLNGHGERVGLAGVVGLGQTVDDDGRVGRFAAVAGTALVARSTNTARSGRELRCCHQRDEQDTEQERGTPAHQYAPPAGGDSPLFLTPVSTAQSVPSAATILT